MKLWVIAPDEASGNDFNEKLKAAGLLTELYLPTIASRVIENQLSQSSEVAQGLHAAISEGINRGFEKQVIACNTLQLWLSEVQTGKARIYTTFEAMKYWFSARDGKPVWLGTTPLVQKMSGFPTLLTVGEEKVQDLVQEIIWRVKGVEGSDVTGAGNLVNKNIKDENILKKRVKHLVWELNGLNIKSVVLGCTELPIAFSKYLDPDYELRFETVDPVVKLADYLKSG